MRSFEVANAKEYALLKDGQGKASAFGFNLKCLPIHQRERIQATSGYTVKEEIHSEAEASKEKIEAITLTICERLLRCMNAVPFMGANLYRPASDGTLHVVCTVDDVAEELLAVKHQVFLPSITRMERAELIKQWLKFSELVHHVRYYVVTAGERCYGHELRKQFRWLHVKLAEFRRALKKRPEFNGIEVLLRTDEFTIKRDSEGNPTFHPHMNLAIHFPYVLGKKLFLKWKEFIDCHFGTHVKDNGQVKDPRELIKYVTKFESKDGEMGLLDLTDTELAGIYAIRAGMKPVQALGAFKEFRRSMRDKRQKIVTTRDLEGVCRLAIVTKAPVAPKKAKQGDEPGENIFVALTEAQPRFSRTIRPALVIRNFNGDFAALRKNLNLHPLRNFVIEAENNNKLRAAGACAEFPESWVHTFTETLEETWGEPQPEVVSTPGKPDLWGPGQGRRKPPS